jgi:hypothetical protein
MSAIISIARSRRFHPELPVSRSHANLSSLGHSHHPVRRRRFKVPSVLVPTVAPPIRGAAVARAGSESSWL